MCKGDLILIERFFTFFIWAKARLISLDGWWNFALEKFALNITNPN